MTTQFDPGPLIAADPAHGHEPPRELTRARLDALLAADPAPKPRARRRRRRRPFAIATAGLAAFAGATTLIATSATSDPAEAFAAQLQGGGIVHMVLDPEKVHEPSGDTTNPRQDEIWVSLADGDWRLRSRLYGHYIDMSFDGRSLINYSSRTGKTTTDEVTSPELVAGRPFPGLLEPSIKPLDDAHLKVAGKTTIDGETVYDLTPRNVPDGLEMHWYVTEDGHLRRMVRAAEDGSSLTTDVRSYEVLEPTAANEALLKPQPR